MTTKEPWLLDLYCKAGGAAKGYAEAGFRVVGVDIEPQANYPYEFHQGDAADFLARWGRCFKVKHASPPCQDHSDLSSVTGLRGNGDQLALIREELRRDGGVYVIENVEGAPMVNPLRLCGTEFGLRVATKNAGTRWLRRHRLFESNADLWGAGGCHCSKKLIIGVYGTGDGGNGRGWKGGSITDRRAVMGIDWMTRDELANAIPPAYTRFVGEQLMAAL